MSQQADAGAGGPGEDWRAAIDGVDAALVDGFQSGFPVEERPFRAVGETLGVSEAEALARVERLRERGVFRRFGAVLNPPVIGSSTLAAVSAPEDRFGMVVEVINGYRQVNHNYRRDHEWNVWFVVTAGTRETRDAILADIEERTGLPVLDLPMLTDYYIDLEFPVVNEDRFARETRPACDSDGVTRSVRTGSEAVREQADGASPDERVARDRSGPSDHASGPSAREQTVEPRVGETLEETEVNATRISEEATAGLSDLDRRLLLAIQDGFPLSATPYRDVATEVDAPVEDVLAAIERLLADGAIKRIGCVVNHVVTGFDANCMVVWDVPDGELDARGEAVGRLPYVTLCYHRPRRPELGWEYNLFTMVHGREESAVDAKVDELATEHLPFAHERLYSTETLKQTGARYDDLVGDAEET